MLPVTDCLGSTSSRNFDAVKTQEENCQKLGLQEGDFTKPGNFSLREYVSSLRSKNIRRNWPFSARILQLCLENGVNQLLPPIQSPDSIKLQTSQIDRERNAVTLEKEKAASAVANAAETESADVFIESENVVELAASQSEPLASETFNRIQEEVNNRPLLTDNGVLKISVKCNSKHAPDSEGDHSTEAVEVDNLKDETYYAHDPDTVPTTRVPYSTTGDNKSVFCSEEIDGNSQPNGRLIVNFCPLSERREEDSTVSTTEGDPMASQICPVCKVFSSPSNTTLNVHIDQCLSQEQVAKDHLSSFAKLPRTLISGTLLSGLTKHPRTKVRKKRLISDILASAPRCTIEDLERRNRITGGPDSASLVENDEVFTDNEQLDGDSIHSSEIRDRNGLYDDSEPCTNSIMGKLDENTCTGSRGDGKVKKPKSLLIPKTRLTSSLFEQSDELPSKISFRSVDLSRNQVSDVSNEEEDGPKEKSLSELLKTEGIGKMTHSSGKLSDEATFDLRSTNRRPNGDNLFKKFSKRGMSYPAKFLSQRSATRHSRIRVNRASSRSDTVDRNIKLSDESRSKFSTSLPPVSTSDGVLCPSRKSERAKTNAYCSVDPVPATTAAEFIKSSPMEKHFSQIWVTKRRKKELLRRKSFEELKASTRARHKALSHVGDGNVRLVRNTSSVEGIGSEAVSINGNASKGKDKGSHLERMVVGFAAEGLHSNLDSSQELLSSYVIPQLDHSDSQWAAKDVLHDSLAALTTGQRSHKRSKKSITMEGGSLSSQSSVHYDSAPVFGNMHLLKPTALIVDRLNDGKETCITDVASEGLTGNTGSVSEDRETEHTSDIMHIDSLDNCVPSFEDIGYELLRRSSLLVASHHQSSVIQDITATDVANLESAAASTHVDNDKLSENRSSISLEATAEDLVPALQPTPACVLYEKAKHECLVENADQITPAPVVLTEGLATSGHVLCKGKNISSIDKNKMSDASIVPVTSLVDLFPSEAVISPHNISSDGSSKFPSSSELNFAGSSNFACIQPAQISVLRLMGKNLVLNHKDGGSPQVETTGWSPVMKNMNPNRNTIPDFSGKVIFNKDESCFCDSSMDSNFPYASSYHSGPVQHGCINPQTPLLPGIWMHANAHPALGFGCSSRLEEVSRDSDWSRVCSLSSGSLTLADAPYQQSSVSTTQDARCHKAVEITDCSSGPQCSPIGLQGMHSGQTSFYRTNFLSCMSSVDRLAEETGNVDDIIQSSSMPALARNQYSLLLCSPVLR